MKNNQLMDVYTQCIMIKAGSLTFSYLQTHLHPLWWEPSDSSVLYKMHNKSLFKL